MCKAERDLIALEKGFRKLRIQMAKMIREISPRSRHAVKDIKVSTSLKASRSEITTDDVVEALKSFSITRGDSGWNVYPPQDKIHPKTWNRIRQVMANNDGDWSTQRQAFVFERDPNPIFKALTQGKLHNSRQERQAFFTPAALASKVVSLAEVKGKAVLEPSAGDGHLAGAIQRAGAASVDCCELDKESVDVLVYKGFNTYVGDFLKMPVSKKYDRVCMNPPFARKTYVAHILQALKHLVKGGRLVAIIPGDMPPKELTTKLPTWSTWNCLPQEAGLFEDTNIKTSILVINLDQGPAKK